MFHSFSFMVQEFLESTILVLVLNILIARIGLLEVSVFNLVNLLLEISWMPMYAYSQAILTIVSKHPKRLKSIRKEAIIRSLKLYGVIASILIFNKGVIFHLLTNQQLLMNECRLLLPYVFLLYIFRQSLMMNQTCLQILGEQRWVLKTTVVCYLVGYFIVFLFIKWNPSLWIIYVGIGTIYLALTYLMKFKLKIK